ncbi:MAG: gliding motility-associated C-terminal domain-containing protein [Paludibacteraceae bacterium]|nr:gliding motility-associated C-terminal domain-containing protein [Paludibacteraceae bacterium]
MKLLIKSFAFVIFWMFASAGLMFSQGVLIFELSDPDNAPIQKLPINISGKVATGEDTTFVLTTDDNGRVVCSTIPAGDYTYNLEYGDYGQGSIHVQNGGYTWIDLDYRTLVVSFVDSVGNPQQGRGLLLFKEFDDGQEDFQFDKRYSKSDGQIKFILPEGKYHYNVGGLIESFVLNDENKTMSFDALGGVVTHNTYFRFLRKDSTDIHVLCKAVKVYAKDEKGQFTKLYGSVDPYSQSLVDQYYLTHITEEYISCAENEFKYAVETKDYGLLEGNFEVKKEHDLNTHYVDIIIPETSQGGGGGGGGGDTIPPFPIDTIEMTRIRLFVISAKDSVTPLPGIVTYTDPRFSGYEWTDEYGEANLLVYPNEYCNIMIAHDTLKNVYVTGDTTIYYYLEDPLYTKVYFNFYCGDEKFNPVSVTDIYACRRGSGYCARYQLLVPEKADSVYIYDNVYMNCILGSYDFDFYLNERNYKTQYRGKFNVTGKDSVMYVDILLEPSHKVQVQVLDLDHNVMPNLCVLFENEAGQTSMIATDETGYADSLFFDGHYKVKVSDQMQEIDLVKDTILYFHLKDIVQNVKIKFLHDGKIVYPQISNLDFYKKETSTLYARLISTYYEDLDGTGEAWVFKDSVPCEVGPYYFSYKMNDYNYTNAEFTFNFNVNGPGSKDTLLYVVVPVKRTVTFRIKDALGALVKGVNADIYKYNEDGTLNSSLDYDYNTHGELKTNTEGIVLDHLLPGRYQIRILDIVRDFVVTDYDLEYEIRSGMELVDVTYYVLYESSKEPVVGVSLEIKKEGEFYTLQYTDEDGAVYTQCEPADYSYYLDYAQKSGTVEVDRKRTVFIYVPDPVMIKSMNIATCQLVNFNDTISLPLTITPSSATLQVVDWSVDNEILARVFSDGKLIVNNIGEKGYFTVTAKSKDGSNVSTSIKMYVGDSFDSDLQLRLDVDKVEAILGSDSINLSVSGGDQFDRYYVYQSSVDSTTWVNAYGPTQERSIILPSSVLASKETFFRAVSATTSSDALALASNRKLSCATGLVSNTVVNRVLDLTPMGWKSSICASNTISLRVDSANISALPEDFKLNWYVKRSGADEYERLDATNKDSVVIDVDSVITVKVAIEKDSVELKKYEKTITIIGSVKFHIVSDDSIYCEGSDALLSLKVESGKPTSILWSNGSTENSIAVTADDTPYSVTIETQNSVCPTLTEHFRFKLDRKAEVDLQADKSAVCQTGKDTVTLYVANASDFDSVFVWTNSKVQDSVRTVVPSKTTKYTVTANSKYGKCGASEASKTIYVDVPVQFAIEPSDSIACAGSDVTFALNVKAGKISAYLWNDSTTDSVMVAPADTILYGVTVESENGGCPAVSDSIRLKIETPVSVELLASEPLICYTRKDSVKLTVVNNSGMEISAYHWNDSLSTTSEAIVLPKVSTTYTVHADSKYGRCHGPEASVTVNVIEPVDASIKADVESICQTGAAKVILTAQSKAGVETPMFIWWDGMKTKDSIRIVAPDTTTTYWVATSNSACVQAGNDSVTVTVAKPAKVTLTTANKVYEYGGTIDFTANATSPVFGPYTWIAVDEYGEETVVGVSKGASFQEMPSGDADYYVKVENGACPSIASGYIKTHLVDNIVIPTVFTPHEKNGENDDFMPGYEVVIYDRYGNVVANSTNGWDGDYRGDVADAGVYIYVLTLKDGRVKKGTIEVYRK